MATSLVGYTGFVGGNLAASHGFDTLYNSKNISEAFGKEHDLVVYCGVRAEKFLANSDPESDKRIIEGAIYNIGRMNPRALVLISTSDVYQDPADVDENTPIDTANLQPYGANRYALERWVSGNIARSLVVRLPGLYGAGLKKNFIYDMITLVPSMLTDSKYDELSQTSGLVREGYERARTGFYKLTASGEKLAALRGYFEKSDFNSLRFTDSRAVYQFYGLQNLWHDINTALEHDIKLINLTAEPVSAAEVYSYVRGGEFKNELTKAPVRYGLRSVHSGLWGSESGYMYSKQYSLEHIKAGVESGAFVK